MPAADAVESNRTSAAASLVPVAKMPAIDLSAMRDVANQTARVAISHHWKRRGLQDAYLKWTMAVCAVAIGVVLGMLANHKQRYSAASIAAFGMFLASAFWAVQGLMRWYGAKLASRAVRGGVARPEPAAADGPDDLRDVR